MPEIAKQNPSATEIPDLERTILEIAKQTPSATGIPDHERTILEIAQKDTAITEKNPEIIEIIEKIKKEGTKWYPIEYAELLDIFIVQNKNPSEDEKMFYPMVIINWKLKIKNNSTLIQSVLDPDGSGCCFDPNSFETRELQKAA